jgi:D-sedoheptulose 7-phosphate isomerase
MKLEDIINKNLAETLKINDISVVDTKFTHGLQVASELLIDTFQKKGKVLLAGNGGSAADAQHIAAEFMGRLNFDRDPLPAIALTANSSNITCIANDYGYDHIFSRQANALAQQDDCLIVYSTSGKSRNILQLVAEIRHKVKHIIALTGLYTDELDKYSDVVLSVNSEKTTRIQEIHAIAGHILCECVEDTLFGHLKNS